MNSAIFWSLFSKVISHSFILIQGMMIARFLGPEGKGLQAKIIAFATLFIFIFDLGLSNSINYFFGHKQFNFHRVRQFMLMIFGAQFILQLILFQVLATPAFQNLILPQETQVYFFFIYISVYIFTENCFFSFTSYLASQLKFKVTNWIDLTSAFAKITSYGYLYFFHFDSVKLTHILLVDMCINLFCLAAVAIYSFRHMSQQACLEEKDGIAFFQFWKNQFPRVLSYSLPLLFSNILFYLNTRLDYWIIAKYLGLKELGLYSVASSGAQLITIIPLAFGTVLLSYLNKASDTEKVHLFTQYSRLHFTLISIVALIGFICSPFIINFLFGQKFNESILLFQLLLVVCVFHSHKYLLGLFLQSMGFSRLKLYSDMITTLVNILGVIFVVKTYGLQGAIFFSLFLQFVSILSIQLFLMHKNIYIKNVFLVSKSEIENISLSLKQGKII